MPVWKLQISRPGVAFVHDVVMAALSFGLALFLRLGDRITFYFTPELWIALGLFTAVCAVVFWLTGLYRGVWRYASMNDLVAIVKAVTLALLIFLPVTFMVTRLEALPRSVLVIDWFVLVFLLGAPRMIYRVVKDRGFDHLLERASHRRVPVLLIGAGDSAEVFIRELARNREAPYEVLGLVDDTGHRAGRRIHGVPVLDHVDHLEAVLAGLRKRGRAPERLVLTRRPEREQLNRILEIADAAGTSVARLPRLTELQSGEEPRLKLRPVAVEDVLGRVRQPLDRTAMRRLIQGRRVLVTGAGGSIGAELARQVAGLGPAHLTLLDNSEYNLYAIDLELGERHGGLSRTALLADVRDRARVDGLMADERPDLVFHAAALKHVPIVEANPVEGVLTNVIGARHVADACRRCGVIAMVLISTDKAVNPSSIMGSTKRLAESYCQALDLTARAASGRATRFVTVRFGNVLGSTGSVVPLFQRQLAGGGPLTVTHPDMTRYFMMISEAVELVLQASALGVARPAEAAGKIHVLEMGEPVRIIDLARQMIRLAGLRPDKDIEIRITGLRPGEKLHEELFHESEPLVPTEHPGLKLAAPRTADLEILERSLEDLAAAARKGDAEEVVRKIRHLVPEYGEPGLERAAH